MTLVRLIARPMLASMFVTGGVDQLRRADRFTDRAAPVTTRLAPMAERATASLPIQVDEKRLVQVNGAVQVVAGTMLASGRAPRLASLVLAASLAPTTYAGHRFWEAPDPGAKAAQRVHFFKNLSMMGGLLLAAVDTEGRPSVAWRARRGARRARSTVSGLAPR